MSEPDCKDYHVEEGKGSMSKHDIVSRRRMRSPSVVRPSNWEIVVEVNLRQPSMLHGKKGFERLVWAAKNVLNRSVTWLFYDLRAAQDSSSGRTLLP
jgi:Ribonuclease P 40kDa (Rpp40) subunit